MSRGAAVFATVVALAALTACDGEAGCSELRISGPDGATRLEGCVVWAQTAEERRRGLVGRDLAPGEVLLIDFPVVGEVCISNAPVDYPIDVVFVDGRGVVRRVDGAVPAGDATARCQPGTWRVIEARSGEAATVQVGDEVRVDEPR